MSFIEDILLWLSLRPKILGEITLSPTQKALEQKYREAIAKVMGVSPEHIREDISEKWLKNWMKAFIKPEYWKLYGLE